MKPLARARRRLNSFLRPGRTTRAFEWSGKPIRQTGIEKHGRDDEWDSVALLQGHAFVNVGDKTSIWYSPWDCEEKHRSEEIGLATLRRDGFGYLSRHDAGETG